MKRTITAWSMGVAVVAALGATGCGSDGASDSSASSAVPGGSSTGETQAPPGATGVSQPGAQDFGLFRQILEAGEVPAPGTLDDVGFFAEHKLDYAAPTCGNSLCAHGLLGVMANLITGSTCTLIQIGLNSPVNVAELPRPPLDLVLVIDTSGSMAGQPIAYVREGLDRMLSHLAPEDTVSIVTYADVGQIVLEPTSAEATLDLKAAIAGLQAAGGTNIYDGLFRGFQLASELRVPGRQARVVALSDGRANRGITDPDRMAALAASWAAKGIGVTTIGVGKDFDVAVMQGIAELGGGNFYFLEDAAAVVEVFSDEVKTFLVPIALDLRIEVAVDSRYRLGGAYGTQAWRPSTGGGGVISLPAVYLAGRTDSSAPIDTGRRGGGGAIVLELMPRPGIAGQGGAHHVGGIYVQYTDPDTGETRAQEIPIEYANAPGVAPPEGWFTTKTVEKGFVMANLLVAFQMASEAAADGDIGSAIGTLQAIDASVTAWTHKTPDPDILDDLTYVGLFIANLQRVGSTTPISAPPEPWVVFTD